MCTDHQQAVILRADLARQLAERNAEHVPGFFVKLTEEQALDVASGYVPVLVQAMVRTMLDWQAIDKRRADRPVRRPKPKPRRSASKRKCLDD